MKSELDDAVAHETAILRWLKRISPLGVVLLETGSHYAAWAVLKLCRPAGPETRDPPALAF